MPLARVGSDRSGSARQKSESPRKSGAARGHTNTEPPNKAYTCVRAHRSPRQGKVAEGRFTKGPCGNWCLPICLCIRVRVRVCERERERERERETKRKDPLGSGKQCGLSPRLSQRLLVSHFLRRIYGNTSCLGFSSFFTTTPRYLQLEPFVYKPAPLRRED
jgi:hypothetical protein